MLCRNRVSDRCGNQIPACSLFTREHNTMGHTGLCSASLSQSFLANILPAAIQPKPLLQQSSPTSVHNTFNNMLSVFSRSQHKPREGLIRLGMQDVPSHIALSRLHSAQLAIRFHRLWNGHLPASQPSNSRADNVNERPTFSGRLWHHLVVFATSRGGIMHEAFCCVKAQSDRTKLLSF